MRIELGCRAIRSAVTAAVTAVALSGVVAACGGGDTTSSSSGASSSTAASGGRQTPAAAASTCGLGNGTKAKGAPIRLGGIATKQPGIDFTDIPNTAKAYFACVNDNGGINGRPIDYTIETEQTDPGQVASLARTLVQREKVLGIVGSTSIIECAVNHRYYEQQGYYIIGSGIAPECYSTPNSAAVNMGPRYSVDGATQYLIRRKVRKLVLDQSNVPGTGYVAGGFLLIANDANIPSETLKDDVPIQDADAIAIELVQAAGAGGGVVLNFTPPEVLKILQAAQRLGLQDRVRWACSTPCNTDFLADALGPQWDGKLGVNAELNLTTANGPDSRLYRDVLRTYAPRIPLGSFSQVGFVEARIATHALRSVRGEHRAGGQRCVQGGQGLQDRHPVQAPVLRRRAAAHPEQHRPDHDSPGRQDGRGGLLRDLRRRPGDRAGAKERGGRRGHVVAAHRPCVAHARPSGGETIRENRRREVFPCRTT